MDLTKHVLQTSIVVHGKAYKVRTDHAYWFRFYELISDEAFVTDFDFLYVDEVPEDRTEGVKQLIEFFSPRKELPRATGKNAERVLDYIIDSDLIFAGVLQQYGLDLIETPTHWHKVKAMIDGLTGTKLNDVIGFRLADQKDKHLMDLKEAWRLPKSTAEKKEEQEFKDLFYNT